MQLATALMLGGLASACADLAVEQGLVFSGALFGAATVLCCIQVVVWLRPWRAR